MSCLWNFPWEPVMQGPSELPATVVESVLRTEWTGWLASDSCTLVNLLVVVSVLCHAINARMMFSHIPSPLTATRNQKPLLVEDNWKVETPNLHSIAFCSEQVDFPLGFCTFLGHLSFVLNILMILFFKDVSRKICNSFTLHIIYDLIYFISRCVSDHFPYR